MGRLLTVVAAATTLTPAAVSPATAASAPAGPAGDSFFAPPAHLVEGRPGTVVWARRSDGLQVLPAAGRTLTVVFRSRSLRGEPIVQSGTVAVPQGRPPRGGWPIVSFFHVTTGSADSCAPSRAAAGNPELERMTRADGIVSRLLLAGVAVARPDGEGIGTPGGHPYLIAASLARSQADIARAARRLGLRIARRWVAAGHSEGGVASISSAEFAPAIAPDLDLRAVAAFAPVTQMRNQADLFSHYLLPGPPGNGLSALASLIITGAGEAEPALARALLDGALSPEATALLPHVEDRCLNELGAADSWGGLAPADIPGPRYEQIRGTFLRVLDENDIASRDLGDLPIRIDHGALDAVAPAPFTAGFVADQAQRGANITFKLWPTATHVDITGDAQAGREAVRWIVEKLRP